ncbi:hypothetical protein [Bowmanella yangjiangensis]|uniref:Sel1 repeat family protein n=1 Tax=Bowmanella yangjiangensis TaxID=2811230 RepID=A0ABS3CSA3_9ALTE|nr:hypothetical protein [Bowmanella yangjiangensis]MBN7819992.1 hypothetical protein [Bowmanella yangjiangensis]
MLKYLRLLIIAVGGACLSVASQQQYIPIMLKQGESDPASLFRAVNVGSDEALSALSEYAQQNQDPYWLRQAAQLGDARSYYRLALNETEEAPHKRLMAKAALAGFAAAQHEMALLSDSAENKRRWLELAAEQDYLPAIISLYQWLLIEEQAEQAEVWLEKAAPRDANSALLLAKLEWRIGKYKQAKSWLSHARDNGVAAAGDYLNWINRYWQRKGNGLAVARNQCVIRLQPVVMSLENMQQMAQLSQSFKQDERLESLPICLLEPVWVKPKQVKCDENWQSHRRLGCDVRQLSRLPLAEDFTHLMVLAPRGKANVHNGIMYLDQGDTYSVFVHELAHFAGFVDEYPLSTDMAEMVCHPYSDAPNLVFVTEAEELPEKLDGWRKTGEEWSMAKARTCNNHQMQAYKGSDRLTFMEYHDQAYIPPLYMALWKQRLENRAELLPAFVNFAQAWEAAGNAELAAQWRQRANLYQFPALADSFQVDSVLSPL